MTRKRVGYDFSPLPKKWHPGWACHKSLFACGLRDRLFVFADGAAMAVYGTDWLASVCQQLDIDGRDRPNVRKALKAFEAAGLLGWDGASLVRFCFLSDAPLVQSVASPTTVAPPSNDRPTTIRRPSDDHPTTVAPPSNIPPESNTQDRSVSVSQREEKEEREERDRERSRAGAHAHETSLPRIGRETAYRQPLGEPDPSQLAEHQREEAARLKALADTRPDPLGRSPDGKVAWDAWTAVCRELSPVRGAETPARMDQVGALARAAVEIAKAHGEHVELSAIARCAFYAFLKAKLATKKPFWFSWILQGDEFERWLEAGMESNPPEWRATFKPLSETEAAE